MSDEGGYTLTEILVVMAIIGLIAAVLTPGLIGQLGRARVKTAQLQLETVVAGVEAFRSDVGRYPTDAEALTALISEPGSADGWTGPYVKSEKVLQDPWGKPITYKIDTTGQRFSITSTGADGATGGSGANRDLSAPAG
jgi:general secretion pathway protein G